MKRIISLAFILVALSACSHVKQMNYFQNRNNMYLKSSNAPPLRVPPNLSQSNIKDYYVIKPATGQAGISDVPPGLKLSNAKKSASPTITVDSRKNLLVNETAKQTWTMVGKCLQRMKIPVLLADSHMQTYLINPDNIYLVNLNPQTAKSTVIFITDKDGKAIPEADSTRILTIISQGLQASHKSHFWSWL